MIRFKHIIALFLFAATWPATTLPQPGQIHIDRIEMMPNEPSPYNVRDWKEVTIQYDSFVYDEQKSGQYLPLVFVNPTGVNYPQNGNFGLHSYVGTNNPNAGEGINVLPSLVGATLVGVDKTNQYGRNWILMSQDYFNKVNGEGIYLNHPSSSSGGDWWYDMMPNIYFYQLNDLYPNLGDADFQFNSIAGQFAAAVRAMGGNDTPWSKASMNYRAWDFVEMEPNPGGVIEPEAAGAFGWILYHAYKRTGNKEYLKGAEWSLEFLSERTENPSYELQLPYGTYTAAKMNAELGTDYDIEKLVNWSFDRGPLRGWGTIVGNWGGFDVSGLVGEANDSGNDYAFFMNGVQQAGALAPMVRYDKRFARAIAKWILNLANASRLYYPGFLPGAYQDSEEWGQTYDPDRIIAHEAMREKFNGFSPFSTGDALNGGWANTNLAIYGSSSVGYLGGIIEKTNDEKILKIDLLKTDFYRDEAYPTYLLFNPYSLSKIVEIDVGPNPVNIYEALSETFIQQGVSNAVALTISPDEAVLVVFTPGGGAVEYDQNKMLVDDVVVDYMQSAQAFNYLPRIQALAALAPEIQLGDSTTLFAKAFDKDSDDLTFSWSATGGTLTGSGTEVTWKATDPEGEYEVVLIVTDEDQNSDTATISLSAVPEINVAPEIIELAKNRNYLDPGDTLELFCQAFDQNGDSIIYTWSANGGSLEGEGSEVTWISPSTEGIFNIEVTVQDLKGATSMESTSVLVKSFVISFGSPIAHYPFAGNADDISGNELHGAVHGPLLVGDVNGNSFNAYFFDGINDRIQVGNDPVLNFENAITVTGWFNAGALPDKETFLVSHGSWQNRWKISIIPDRHIRWTINTQAGPIGDLDSEVVVEEDSFYHVGATYDGELLALYLNGELNSYRLFSGNIRTSPVDLLIGQMLPDNQEYNFRGTIDEVKIFDYALVPEQVRALYEEDLISATEKPDKNFVENGFTIHPNPVESSLTIHIPGFNGKYAFLIIYDQLGQVMKHRKIESLTSGLLLTKRLDVSGLQPGIYFLEIRSSNENITQKFLKL